MSASEKLKAMQPSSWATSTSAQRSELMAVLPQIVAVVEQLERVLAPWEKVKTGEWGRATDEVLGPARAALTALEEALS